MTGIQDGTTDARHNNLNRRQALGLAGVAAAGAVGTTVLSAAPAAAGSGPWEGSEVVPMPSVSLALAKRIVAEAIEYVEDNDLPPMFVVVVDTCGDEKASGRMDGNGAASVVLAPIKARTAAAFRTSTAALAERVASSPAAIASFTTAGFSLLGGGVPIVVDETVVGAVGVGGGSPEQDDEVAMAALDEALD